MQFKPDDELKEPRHILQPSLAIDGGDFQSISTPGPEPEISTCFEVDIADKTLLVVPEVLYKFYNTLVEDKRLNPKEIGEFHVQCAHIGPKTSAPVELEDGYEEDQQQGNAAGVNSTFPIVLLDNRVMIVKVPKFENKAIYNWIAKHVSTLVVAELITIGTASLGDEDEILEMNKNAKQLKTEIGIVGLPAALFNFCNSQLFVVNASGFFIDDFEIVSTSKFDFLAARILKMESTFFSFRESENFLYL